MTHNHTVNDTAPEDKSAGLSFLHWLYGDDPPGWLTIWTLPDKETAWFPGNELSSAATYAQDRATTHDVYVGVGLRERRLPQGRGTAGDVQAVPGLYLDIDLQDDHAHKKTHLPETVTQVFDLLQHTIPARPTFVIHSGYGLHLYWLFRELYLIEDKAARQWIARLNQRLQTAFQDAAKVHGWTIDSTFDLARVLRLPGTINHKRPEALRPVEILEADEDCRYNPSELDQLLPEIEVVIGEAQPFDTGAELASIDVETLDIPVWLKYLIAQGQDPTYRGKHPSRSEAHGHVTEALLKAGVDAEIIMSLLLDARYKISERPREKGRRWLADDIARIKAKMNGHRPGTLATVEDECNAPSNGDIGEASDHHQVRLPRSDYTNAVALVNAHGHNLHYSHPAKSWYVWDNRRWLADETAAVMRLATETIKAMAGHIPRMDTEQAKGLLAHIKSSLSTSRLKALVDQASWLPGVPILPKEMDQNPWLLNCLNGTLDLQTGELQPHRREDLITMSTAAEYHPDARSKIFESSLVRILPDETDRRYVQKAAGYSLTGLGTEDVLFFPFGPTKTGKSTLLKALRATWGDYATTADFETFLTREHVTGAPRADIAGLAGKRLVVSLEVDQGKKLAEALIKWLFGGDYVTARFLYKKEFEFLPTFKLWLASNHRPQVSSDDDAIWERIRQIPFEQTIPKEERDPAIKAELSDPTQSGAAILAWAVEGCLLWQQEGLSVPKHVEDTTDAYRKEMDPLPDFIEACLMKDDNGRILNAAMWECYQIWSRKNRDRPKLGRKSFTQRLEHAGIDSMPSGGYLYWIGVRLRYQSTGEPEASEKASDEL